MGAGIAAGLLTWLLQCVEHLMGPGPNILDAAARSHYPRQVWVLLSTGMLTGLGQLTLQHLSSANGIDIAEAITRFAGRLSAARTLGSALLSVIVVVWAHRLGERGRPIRPRGPSWRASAQAHLAGPISGTENSGAPGEIASGPSAPWPRLRSAGPFASLRRPNRLRRFVELPTSWFVARWVMALIASQRT